MHLRLQLRTQHLKIFCTDLIIDLAPSGSCAPRPKSNVIANLADPEWLTWGVIAIIFAAFSAVSCGRAFAENKVIDFDVNSATHAELNISDEKISYLVVGDGGEYFGGFDIDADSEIHVDIDDYLFNGDKGFSVWYFDLGMGAHTIHRVFGFSRKADGFVEYFPNCGGEFIDLRIDRINSKLISTYYDENVPKICVTRLHK